MKHSLRIPLLLVFFLGALGNCRVHTAPEPDLQPDMRDKIVALARSLIGIPYSYGGTDIDGFDCSGLVQYVYSCFGFELPRTAREQQLRKVKIKLDDARPGDLLIFRMRRIWHAAVYIGGNRFIHSPNRRGYVREEPITEYWARRLKGVYNILRLQ